MQRSRRRKLLKEAIKFNTTGRARIIAVGVRGMHPLVEKEFRAKDKKWIIKEITMNSVSGRMDVLQKD